MSKRSRRLLLPLLLLAAALALSACGGGSSSSGDEASIETAIEEVATSEDPATCAKYQTESFTEAEDEGGLTECEEIAEAGTSVSESVAVSNIEIEGETATADAAITGNVLDGQTIEAEVVKEGGAWKLNAITGFAKFDSAAFSESLEERLAAEEGISPELAACVTEGLGEISQEEAEEFFLEHEQEPLEKAAQECG
jgi:ABC-type glycerol-3-phosphate transport system substrate-binding protein